MPKIIKTGNERANKRILSQVPFLEENNVELNSQIVYSASTNQHLYLCSMNASMINKKWLALQHKTAEDFDTDIPDIKVFLFLIGVQELGKGPQKFNKRQKEELMHIATCRLFSAMGFYELEGMDQDGWPHWKLVKTIPNYTLLEQEMIIKSLVIDYFEDIDSD